MDDNDFLMRLAEHGGSRTAADIGALIDRLASTPSSRWRGEWLDLLFPSLPDELSAELRQRVAAGGFAVQPGRGRVQAVRSLFDAVGIDAFVVPQADEYRSSSLPANARRLQWMTGFSGSAGTAVVTRNAAWLFVDGRYILQAQDEVDASEIEPRHFRKPPTLEFLAATLPKGTRFGYDPRLHSASEVTGMGAALQPVGLVLTPVQQNPIDTLWVGRPPRPFSAIVPQDDALAGQSASDKRDDIAAAVRAAGADALVINQPESIAWLFNIRAGDATFSPVAQSVAILHGDGHAELFVEREKLTQAAVRHLGNHTTIMDIGDVDGALAANGASRRKVAIDPGNTTSQVELVLRSSGAQVVSLADPILSARMKKNATELDNIRNAMARDGAAMTKFMRWLSERHPDNLPDELQLAERVTAFRAEDPLFRGPSFPPIVGVGPNGAIIHYHPEPRTNRRLEPGVPLLIDSGGQYLTGTTDITRTMCVGQAGDFERRMFTTVLRGHIALAVAMFPVGTTGSQLDGIARAPIWSAGVNFDHGTGHGIGNYLSVHEGQIRIAPGAETPLHANLLISNEPGAYFAGRFGIRIENTLVVTEAPAGYGGEAFLRFETISVAPFQRSLIDLAMLSAAERRWIDDYHAMVRVRVAPFLRGPDLDWLHTATEALPT